MHEFIKDNLSALCNHITTTELIDSNFGKDPRSILCYCYGLASTLASNQILKERGSFLIQLVQTLRTIADDHSNDQTILLGVCRALAQMTKSFLTVNFMENVLLDDVKVESFFMLHLVPHCLSFVWAYFEHHLDTVRHFSKDIFRNLLKLSHLRDDMCAFIRVNILSTIMSNEIGRNAQYMAVENLCQDMKVGTIIDTWPTIFDDLLIDLEDSKCLSCYQKLMVMHCKEINIQTWYELWIQSLLYNSSSSIDLQVKESLVNVAVKTHPSVAGYFLKEKEKLPLELYLFVVSTIRRNGLKLGLDFMPAEDELICRAKVGAFS